MDPARTWSTLSNYVVHCVKMQLPSVLLLLFLVVIVNCESLTSSTNITNRKSRFWGIGLVRFANSVCTAKDGKSGTCYTKRQCYDIGGTPAGRCAKNIGVCCVLYQTCGSASSYNNTYFISPSSVSQSKCAFTINKCNSDICQVRIDFINFNIAQPDGNGTCCVDAFHVIGGASTLPPICGENSGGHMYVDFNDADSINLLIQIGSSSAVSRSWKMRIAQIECASTSRAPSGCLQYFTATSGTVNSFNYGTTASSYPNVLAGDVGTRQIANTNYGVCVAMAPGYCSITWSPVSGDPFAFTLSNSTQNATRDGTLGSVSVYQNGTSCTGDFIIIPNGLVSSAPTYVDRYCGNGLPTITTYSKPFVLTAVTNDYERAISTANRGFYLSYTQNLCTNPCPLCGSLLFG